MTSSNDYQDLNDTDAQRLWRNISQIIKLADESAEHGSGVNHRIYTLARDCRDLLLMDQTSRETLRRLLNDNGSESVLGLDFPLKVQKLARENRKIEAIKELRAHTDCGLKEAKDAVETWLAQNGLNW